MDDKIIRRDDEYPSLKDGPMDYLAAALKAGAGSVPAVGSFLAETIGSVIPNQRLDRVARFAQVLRDNLSLLDQELVRQRTRTQEFVDLLEDGTWQAARALTDERRKQIANVLTHAITDEQLEHLQKKKLLSILGQLDDAEIVMLTGYALQRLQFGDADAERALEALEQKHGHVLMEPELYEDAGDGEISRHSMWKARKDNLIALGLLEVSYDTQVLSQRGELRIRDVEVAPIGQLLWQYIRDGAGAESG